MNFENPFQNPPPEKNIPEEEKNEQQKKKPGGKIGKWLKKNAALATAVGVGYLGSIQEGMAGDTPKIESGTGTKLEHRESKVEGTHERMIESTDSFDVLHRDAESTWGVEYVQKQNKDGRGYLAQRYVKIENKSGKTVTLGEYDNVFQAAEGISKIAGIPEQVRKHAQRDAAVIQTEKDFQRSGFTEPTGNPEGKTHIEERTFEGYDIKAKNKVEVDEKGKVVRLIDSESLDSGK